MSKSTPGPWTAKLNHWSRWEIHYGGGQLATIAKHDDPASPPSIPECEANARLIAAAPDLLAKCKKIAVWLDGLATKAERDAGETRFITMREAFQWDAKNYRATLKDVQEVIKKAEGAQ